MTQKHAVVLFNLGAPNSLQAVKPFLRNLFSDPAILDAPRLVRFFLARRIAAKRTSAAKANYARLGGASPLLPQTEEQAEALLAALRITGVDRPGDEVRVFICMRYWHPMTEQVVAQVKGFGPDRVTLVPLYPQFSTTTTASSIGEWRRVAKAAGVIAATRAVCCWPDLPGFIQAQAARLRERLKEARAQGVPRVLFSAHGLPERIVAKGDPYPDHVERSAAAIAEAAELEPEEWVVCYQSRVGPLKWIEPYTEDEITRCAEDMRVPVVVPLAFVSEHSETLVELDEEYRDLATEAGVPGYVRVPTVQCHPAFIEGLAGMIRAVWRDPPMADAFWAAGAGGTCPETAGACPFRQDSAS